MKKTILISLMLLLSLVWGFAQTGIKGIVKNADSGTPLSGVTVTLMGQDISTQTNAAGEFTFAFLEAGDEELSLTRNGYFPDIKAIRIVAGKEIDLGTFYLTVDAQAEMRQDAVIQLSESNLMEDEGRATQSVAMGLAQSDVYSSQTSYAFSPMRFRMRGYDQEFEGTYINGVHFNTLDRGGFNYSSLGGLNDANRNKDVTLGIAPNGYSFGSVGTTTNIINNASSFAVGTKTSLAYSNRSYHLRGQITHATGLNEKGWAFAISAVGRWAKEGIIDGTFYNSAGLFLAVDKVFNPYHTLSLVAYAAPTQRAQQSGSTQEVFDLVGSTYYNSYWGYQNGEKRNSRIVKSLDPTAILTHDFKIDNNQRLRTGLGFHYSRYSNSALGFYNAPDPRPDYYRYLPSFQSSPDLANQIAEKWKFKDGKPLYPNVSQINWDALYLANYKNNVADPNGSAKYIVERRHNDLMEAVFNSTYTNRIGEKLKLTAGVEAKYGKKMSYKTIDDLLGGKQWIDIDQFAERDFPANSQIIQNDLNNPNRVVKKGDVFGYKYDINILHSSAFLQNEWNFQNIDLYYAAKITYTQFYREGFMKNGRAPLNSYGKAKTWWFLDPGFKAGIAYKPNGNSRFYANLLAESKAPIANNAFVSQRIKSSIVPNLQSRQIYSYDVNYSFSFKDVRGRISAYQTHVLNGTENLGYYDDELRTFVNHLLTKSDRIFRGFEIAAYGKINDSFSVSATQTFADYRYTNNAVGIKSVENGSKADTEETILTKDLMVNAGPQMAFNVTLNYFHPKMWFADITLNYFDKNFLDFAPNRFTQTNMAKYTTPEAKQVLGTQERLKGGFMLDASIGKVIYLKNRHSININLSFSNILNNRKMVTGGYQQARLPLTDGQLDMNNLNRFPNKYYYAWGFNTFINVGYRF